MLLILPFCIKAPEPVPLWILCIFVHLLDMTTMHDIIRVHPNAPRIILPRIWCNFLVDWILRPWCYKAIHQGNVSCWPIAICWFVFSTSDFYQMCYCYRKLGNLLIFSVFVGGRGALIGWDSLTDLSEPIRGARPPKHSASHIFSCDLSEPIRGEHSLSRTRPIGLYRAMQSDPWGRLTDFMAKRIASPCRVRSVCVRGRSASHRQITWLCGERPWDAEVGGRSDSLTDHMTLWWEAEVRGRGSPIGLPRLAGRESPILGPVAPLPGEAARSARERCDWPEDRTLTAGQPWEADRTPMASHGLPHGLTDHRSDSLTDLTLWQITQIRLILANLSDVS